MNEASSHHTDHDALELLLAEALAALENGGEAALEQFLAGRPAATMRLREALADLKAADLLLPPATEVPHQLGEFRIREVLGQGGMGIVYLAEQTSLGRTVALKVVRPELLFFDGARERFRREIDAVAKLEHPAIVPILATGIADGIPYYAMPRIRGRSAEAVVKAIADRDPRTMHGTDLQAALMGPVRAEETDTDGTFAGSWWRAVVRLVRKAALGIHHAHGRGVLHRDLKPSNLMLTADGRAIVLDFGLAHGRGDQSLTRTGSTLGSPAYMAPEQVRGESACERTDVYGLAATMLCLLTLRPPFPATDPEVLRGQILAGARTDRRALAALPTELRLVLETAMDVERRHRYATSQAFADDLQAVLEGRPILAQRLPVRVRVRRLITRHRALATAAAALLAFVVLLPSILLWQQHAANTELARQATRADHSAQVAVDAVEQVLARFAIERMFHVPAAQDVAADMLRTALEQFDRLAADASQATNVRLLRLRALQRLANVEAARGRDDEAIAAAQRGSDLVADDEPDPAIRLQHAVGRRILAGLWLDRGNTDAVEPMLAVIAAGLATLPGTPEFQQPVRDERAHLHAYAAALATKRGDTATAEAALRDCVAAYRQAANSLAVASAQINLGQFLKQQQRVDEAIPCFETALQIAVSADARPNAWPVPVRVEASAHRELAACRRLQGRDRDAMAAYHEALRAFDRFVAGYPDEPMARVARGCTSNDLAQIHVTKREWAPARALLEAACRDQLAAAVSVHTAEVAQRSLAEHRLSLSVCLRELGDLAALETVARELGAMTGRSRLTLSAARNLLRCAEAAAAAEPARAASLRQEALDLLVETRRRKGQVTLDDPLYAPLRNEPRFLAIATVKTDTSDDGK
ncbi:MAG: serine/threonine protein kinase [Planctomycetes bacterium]|nr:serine/threonine protein kinase [Planctomycetota bacterium]